MKGVQNEIRLQYRVKEGNIQAFETLFRAYYEPLCRLAVGFVKDLDTAEEIVQDFFFNYWKNREEINIKVSVKAYLYNAVRNASLKHLERQDVRRRYAERVLAGNEQPKQVLVTDEIGAREMLREIDEALATLPERCRVVFKMSRYEGLKYHEIAEELSVSVKTVEADMTRTLKLLRERLARFQEEPEIKTWPLQ
ncbi:MAG: RNA polymerase sigma-70 factor [Bacteroides sp.]|jgi:RNA polymerase sigma-70 factor (ECF subfamily)|nr:RNA polymerase sigma-70 factor [Bacteroides sp.]